MSSYKSVIKNVGLLSSAKIIFLALSVIRNKFTAVWLGADGMGIMSMFNAILSPATTLADMGVSTSAVRNIASSKDDYETARQVKAIQTFYVLSLLLTISIMVLLAGFLKRRMLTDSLGTWTVYALAFVAAFSVLSNFFNSVLQAKGKIAKLVTAQLYSTIIGSVFTLVIIYFFRIDGIVWGLLVGAMIGLPIGWYFFNKLHIPKVEISAKDSISIIKDLLLTGGLVTLAGFSATMCIVFAKVFLLNHLGLKVVGFYEVSVAFSNIYIGMILQSMGTDFFPRLCQVVGQPRQMYQLVNEQMEIGLLFATIGVDICLIIAPTLLITLYNSEFIAATDMLRWQCVGVGLRVLGYPLGYLLMAQRRNIAYFCLQLSFWCSYYLAITGGVRFFGMKFIGIDYIFAYAIYLCFGYILAYKTGLRPTPLLKKVFIFSLSSQFILLLSVFLLPPPYSYLVASIFYIYVLWKADQILKLHFEINLMANLRIMLSRIRLRIFKHDNSE
ncbi:oligosaccharide flippase family protein [Alistipes sp.]|uniref:oligosaccharide flippase family protein n=1 Tax=Alistipes sp. TaxID=1872444 RepID=UPI003AF10D42